MITRRERGMLAHLPSWTVLPLIGNALKFIGKRNDLSKYYNEVSEIIEETKLPFVIWLGNIYGVVLSDPEEVRAVSTNNLDKSYIYDFTHIVFGEGLVTARGAIWKNNIKKLGSAFKSSAVDAFQVVFNEQSRGLIKSLETEVGGGPFELQHKYLTNVTLRAVSQSALGISGDGDIIDEKFTHAFVRVMELILDRTMNIWLHSEAVYRLTPAYKESEKCAGIVCNITEKVLRQRINQKEDKINVDNGNQDSDVSMKSFLDLLLEMRETDSSLTEEQIKYELTTILLAGQETAAAALNFILLTLGCKPDVQGKLYREIRNVFGDTRRPVSKEDLGRLIYCEAVINETLRLYPPVPAILRYADHDVQLKSCTIPKGTTCVFNIWGSGRSKHIWGPDALLYKPERWLDPSTASKYASALLTFSTGRRACIGRRYAVNLIKTILVHCLTEYEFISEADKMTLQMDVFLRPKSGNLLQIRRRSA
ncbi:unnamed protein product, partial [Iphiclides podalirius]